MRPSRDVMCDIRLLVGPSKIRQHRSSPRLIPFSSSDFGMAVSTYSLVKVDGVLPGDNVGDGGAAALLSSLSRHFLFN